MKIIVPNMSGDIIFICDDGNSRVDAPSIVLAACSEFFKKLIVNLTSIKPMAICVPEASKLEIECILKYAFYGRFEDNVEQVSWTEEVI